MLTFAGSVITSYAKARTALEAQISNEGWPELFERLERIIYTCVMLVAAGLAFAIPHTEETGLGYGATALIGLALAALPLAAAARAGQRAARAEIPQAGKAGLNADQ